jgi:hypothetical protein
VRKLQGVLLGSIRLTFETSHDTIHSNTRYIAINSHNHNDDRGQHWEAQLRKGCLEMARQASLWQSRLYGLEILRSLSVRSQLDVAEGTLYPILSTKKVIVPVIPTLSRRQLVRSKSQGENPQPASGE